MKPNAIVYTSNTGHTERYARLLGEATGLGVIELTEAKKMLPRGERIIYMGWLFASSVKGFSKANDYFDIKAVVGVGLCPTGTLLDEVRAAIKLHESTPLFTVQGGMDKEKLRGINKFMINALTKSLESKKEKDEKDLAMLDLLSQSGDLVSADNLNKTVNWFNMVQKSQNY